MSLDIMMDCTRNGESAPFKRVLVDEIFGRNAVDPRFPLQSVEYSDGGGEIYGAEEGEYISGIMVTHCGGDTFFQAFYDLAERTGSFIWWPDTEPSCLLFPPSVNAKDVPEGVLEMCGPPRVVANGREIEEAIYGPVDDEADKP